MKLNDIDWNFDRVVRLTIKCPGRAIEYDSEGKKTVNAVVIEYNPLDDARKVARIDFTCDCLTQLKDITAPSYTAEIKLYNISKELANAIGQGGEEIAAVFSGKGVAERRKAYTSRNSIRPQVTLEIGYYNHENPSQTSLWKLFDGYINSSFSARQGQDYVTTLQCWKYDGSLPGDANFCMASTEYEYKSMKEDLINKRGEAYEGTVKDVIAKVIWDYATSRPTIEEIPVSEQISSFSGTKENVSKQGAQRSFIQIDTKFNEPGDKWKDNHKFTDVFDVRFTTDASGETLDKDLEYRLLNLWGASFKAYTNGETNLDKILAEVLAQTGLNLDYYPDRSLTKADKYIWNIYYAGGRGTSTSADGGLIEIVNYQNVVETPMINGNGSLQLKTMIIPGVSTKSKLRLTVKDIDSESAANLGAPSFSGIKATTFSGSNGRFTPLLSGEYASAVLINDAKDKGSIFNHTFNLWKISYSGSTHSREWFNTLYSFPSFLGAGV
jgi:hypothetical protein